MTDDEWAFLAPKPVLTRLTAPQRRYDPREVLDGLRWMVRTAAQWRMHVTAANE